MELCVATPDEARARDRLSHAVWGGDMPVEAYVSREAALRGTAWPRRALTTWLLRDGDEVLSSCEAYRVPVAAGGAAWAIASVYTAPEHRGHGHALALLDRLADRLAGEPDARAMVLFSDIPPAIYARIGYTARPALDHVLPAAPGGPALAPGRVTGAGGPFHLRPDDDQLRWHGDRVGRTLGGGRLGSGAICWVPMPDHLLILELVPGDARDGLLAAAAAEAHRLGLPTARCWATPDLPGDAPRDGAVPMLRPLAPGVRASDWTHVGRGSWV